LSNGQTLSARKPRSNSKRGKYRVDGYFTIFHDKLEYCTFSIVASSGLLFLTQQKLNYVVYIFVLQVDRPRTVCSLRLWFFYVYAFICTKRCYSFIALHSI